MKRQPLYNLVCYHPHPPGTVYHLQSLRPSFKYLFALLSIPTKLTSRRNHSDHIVQNHAVSILVYPRWMVECYPEEEEKFVCEFSVKEKYQDQSTTILREQELGMAALTGICLL